MGTSEIGKIVLAEHSAQMFAEATTKAVKENFDVRFQAVETKMDEFREDQRKFNEKIEESFNRTSDALLKFQTVMVGDPMIKESGMLPQLLKTQNDLFEGLTDQRKYLDEYKKEVAATMRIAEEATQRADAATTALFEDRLKALEKRLRKIEKVAIGSIAATIGAVLIAAIKSKGLAGIVGYLLKLLGSLS